MTLKVAPLSYNHEEFLKALAQGDKAAWIRTFDMNLRAIESRGGGTVEVATPAASIFDFLDERIEPERTVYRDSARALVAQAELITKRLDAALGGGLVYRAN